MSAARSSLRSVVYVLVFCSSTQTITGRWTNRAIRFSRGSRSINVYMGIPGDGAIDQWIRMKNLKAIYESYHELALSWVIECSAEDEFISWTVLKKYGSVWTQVNFKLHTRICLTGARVTSKITSLFSLVILTFEPTKCPGGRSYSLVKARCLLYIENSYKTFNIAIRRANINSDWLTVIVIISAKNIGFGDVFIPKPIEHLKLWWQNQCTASWINY